MDENYLTYSSNLITYTEKRHESYVLLNFNQLHCCCH